MRTWVLALGLLATAASPGADRARGPKPEFLALPPAERNLAVYEAFWTTVLDNYYDPRMLAAPQWHALREDWRARAIAGAGTDALYAEVFSDITAKLPESHVAAELPTPALPDAAQRYPERLARLRKVAAGGMGMAWTEVRRQGRKFALVTEVLPDTPAAEAGIRPGWRVLTAHSTIDVEQDTVRFNGEFVPLESREALAWESGETEPVSPDPATVLRVQFEQRRWRDRPAVESRRLAGGVRYLRFDRFGDDRFMKPVFEALEQAGEAGLVIDLRWNGGGLASQLQRVAGMLLGDSLVLGTFHSVRGVQPLMSTLPARQTFSGPLVLLIGPSTGSCAEMLAAAVQDYRRGLLVGRRTHGSALMSRLFPLPDGGLVLVPISDFRTSHDRRLEGAGVAPDVRVMPSAEDLRTGRDPVLEHALELLRTAPAPATAVAR